MRRRLISVRPSQLGIAALLILTLAVFFSAPAPAGAAAGCTAAAASDVIYLPNITKTLGGPDGWVTPFIIQNIGSTPADLEVYFYRLDDGSLVACRRISGVQPHASWADIPNNDIDLPDNTQFAVLVRAYGSSIAGVVNEQVGSADAPVAMSYNGLSAGATSVSLPNVTRRFYGYDTPFIVQNLGNATAAVIATFVSFDGTRRFVLPLTILPARAKPVDPDYTPGLVDGTQYSVTLTSDQPIAAIVNEFNAFHPFGRPLADSYNGFVAADGAPDLYIPRFEKTYYPRYGCCTDAAPFADSPVVIQNMDSKAVVPTISFDGSGQDFSTTSSSTYLISNLTFTGPTLAPGASWAFDPLYTVGTTTPCNAAPPLPSPPTCLPVGIYSAHVHANGLLAARPTIERCCYNIKQSVSFRAEPLAPMLFMPNVVKTLDWSGGWNSFIYVRVADPSLTPVFTAYWYRFSDGALVATQRSNVCAYQQQQGCLRFQFSGDPRDDPNLAEATQYSVVIDATGGTPVSAVVITYRTCADCGDAMAYEAILGR